MIESALNWIVTTGNNLLWSYILIGLLIGLGIYFTIRTKFVQFRLFGEMFKLIVEKPEVKGGISSFQAFTISAASRVEQGILLGSPLRLASEGRAQFSGCGSLRSSEWRLRLSKVRSRKCIK